MISFLYILAAPAGDASAIAPPAATAVSYSIVAGVLAAGVALWLFGRSLSRFGFAAVGIVLGGATGVVLPAAVGLGVAAWLTGAIGAVIGLIIGLATLRFATALSLGLLLAMVSPFVVTAVLEFGPAPAAPADELAELPDVAQLLDSADDPLDEMAKAAAKEAVQDIFPGDSGAADDAAAPDAAPAEDSETEKTVRAGLARIISFLEGLGAELRPRWQALDARARLLYVGAAGLALAVGAALAMLAPQRSAAVVTGFLGAAVWLSAAVWLLHLAGGQLPAVAPNAALGWLLIWAIVGTIGAGWQWLRLRRKKARLVQVENGDA